MPAVDPRRRRRFRSNAKTHDPLWVAAPIEPNDAVPDMNDHKPLSCETPRAMFYCVFLLVRWVELVFVLKVKTMGAR